MDQAAVDFCRNIGTKRSVRAGFRIFVTELTRTQIEQLSDQSWVLKITISKNLQIVQE